MYKIEYTGHSITILSFNSVHFQHRFSTENMVISRIPLHVNMFQYVYSRHFDNDGQLSKTISYQYQTTFKLLLSHYTLYVDF